MWAKAKKPCETRKWKAHRNRDRDREKFRSEIGSRGNIRGRTKAYKRRSCMRNSENVAGVVRCEQEDTATAAEKNLQLRRRRYSNGSTIAKKTWTTERVG